MFSNFQIFHQLNEVWDDSKKQSFDFVIFFFFFLDSKNQNTLFKLVIYTQHNIYGFYCPEFCKKKKKVLIEKNLITWYN